jgi:glycosyltransferase involved in cell wall biosynthesis
LTADERPQVSVVIASVNGVSYLDACLAALARQRGGVRAEVVVADCCGDGARELVAREYPWVRLLSFAERRPVPELRAIGIAHSRGDVVAVTEDHCIPAEDWFERIVARHRGPYAAVGGAVENAATERLVDWAVFLCEYSRYVNPVPRGVTDDIPGNNVAYKREALAHIQDLLDAGRWEHFLHWRLQEAGLELCSDPANVVHHRKSFTIREFLEQRFHYGRSFAGMRVEGGPFWRRLMFAFGSPILPPLLLGRIADRLFRRRRHRLIFLRSCPLLALFTLSWTAGELIGYLTGPGDSLARVE